MIESVCDYVLSQDHERDATIEVMIGDIKHSTLKWQVIDDAKNMIYYQAMWLQYGKREANKALNECYKEARALCKN